MAEPTSPAGEASDGSMETILASIRRIIREDEAASAPAAAQVPASAALHVAGQPEPDSDEDELLVLETSMIVQAPQPEEPGMTRSNDDETPVPAARLAAAPPLTAAALAAALFDDEPAPPVPVVAVPEAALPRPTHALLDHSDDSLLAPQARAAAAQSLAALQQAAQPEPAVPAGLRLLRSGGPTLEDLVRDELRGQLKNWLDDNLPGLVERLVAREIERLVRPG